MGIRCPESGKATALMVLPLRRVRCIVCNRLVKLRYAAPNGVIVVSAHQFRRFGAYAAVNVLKRLL
jgi:hypothetical protein